MWADTIGQCGPTPYGTMGRHHTALWADTIGHYQLLQPSLATFSNFTTFISYFYQLLLATFTTFISYFYQLLLLLL